MDSDVSGRVCIILHGCQQFMVSVKGSCVWAESVRQGQTDQVLNVTLDASRTSILEQGFKQIHTKRYVAIHRKGFILPRDYDDQKHDHQCLSIPYVHIFYVYLFNNCLNTFTEDALVQSLASFSVLQKPALR